MWGVEKMYENGKNGKSLSYGKRIKSSIHSSPFLTAGINLEEIA
jgi:hypothetical protein